MLILNYENLMKTQGIEAEFDVARIATPIVTGETFAEFMAMDKAEQMKLKDQGGFLAAISSDGTRKKDAIVARTMLVLDLDDADVTTLETIKSNAFCKMWVHSTRKHTATKPRYRLIVPLAHPVPSDEYEPLARFFAREMNILDACDTAGFRTAQVMLWPTVSCDMVDNFVFYEAPCDELLEPAGFLARFEADNVAKWPRKSEEIKAVVREVKECSDDDDPRNKVGIVGAFCRTYTVEEAIEAFLADIYAPSSVTGRYDLLAADSVGGLAIYDEVFAFSFHSKDEAAGKLLNAYDLVRVHRFGMLDADATPGTPFSRLPSNVEMAKFALSIPEVRDNIIIGNDGDKDFISAEVKSKLEYNSFGKIKHTLANVIAIIENDEKLAGISFNEFTQKLTIVDDVPWREGKSDFNDYDIAGLTAYLSCVYKLEVAERFLLNALKNIAFSRTYHPVKNWLNNLPKWDGINRLEMYLVNYLGASDNAYVRYVSKVILIASIARIMVPGTKFDIVPVLVGPQGCGKSTLYGRLFGVWFSDSLNLGDLRDKTAIEKIGGALCLEIAELSGMAKAEIELVKAFFTRQVDKCRPAYGRSVVELPRQCVFVATTNQVEGFLRDSSGNRRFAPVEVNGSSELHPWDLTDNDVNQIWSEALTCYEEGNYKIFFDSEIKATAEAMQKAFLVHDERRGLVETYLAKPIPKNWLKLSDEARIDFLRSGLPMEGIEGTHGTATSKDFQEPFVLRDRVSNIEVFVECFGKKAVEINRKDSTEIAQIMASIGWIPSGETYMTPYGKQRFYVRQQ